MSNPTLLSKRQAGVLCHITSLPGDQKFGDFGQDAYKFVDFLSNSGFSMWQILPLGPTHSDNSPYLSLSAHAGNTNLININWLCGNGWLEQSDLEHLSIGDPDYIKKCLCIAYSKVVENHDNDKAIKFYQFIKKHEYWLTTFSLFMALREHFEHKPWASWPIEYRDRDPYTLEAFSEKHHSSIKEFQFQQFIFFSQWQELNEYANNKGISILGDMPIFVSLESAEVWANRNYFTLDESGEPEFVAGVPPDYFSETGQRWGNPLYRWSNLEKDGFSWWVDRIKTQCELYDAIRIDHFLGLVRHWEIPSSEPTAINGRWVPVPGKHLLQILTQVFPNIHFIAEDLGTVTPEILALRDEFSLPGMVVMQFAFDGSQDNPHLPKNHTQNSVVYSATHDNDTTLGWHDSLSNETKDYINECLDTEQKYENEEMPWPIIHTALESQANLAMFPMQDIMGLDGKHRMNTPGTTENNWQWRFNWKQVDKNLPVKLNNLLISSKRL